MKTKKINLKVCMIIILSILTSSPFNPIRIKVSGANANTVATTIENNSAYYIRSSLNMSKTMDIRNGSYANDSDVLLYDVHNHANQRFILSKADNETYFIKPLQESLKYLAIKGGATSENAKFVIRPEEFSGTAIKANRFKFIFNPSTSSFRIATGASDFSKYLTLKNANIANSNEVVQKSAPSSGFTSYYEWKLVKTDNLTVNSINLTSVNANSSRFFNIRVPRTVTYIIESRTNALSKLNLYRSSDNVLFGTSFTHTNGYQRIYCNLIAGVDYHVWFTNLSNLSPTFEMVLFPEKEVYFSSYYKVRDLDTTIDVTNHYSNFEDNNYYVNHLNNTAKDNLLTYTNANGKTAIANEYYMISSHGSEGGDTYVAPTKSFKPYELPPLNNVKVAVWSTCYGGKSGNVAEVSVNSKNAEAAIGWPGLSFTDTARVFTNHFWPKILTGKNIETAYSEALTEAKNSAWFFWTNILGDSLEHLKLYQRNSNNVAMSDSVYSFDYSGYDRVYEIKDKQVYTLFSEKFGQKRYVKLIDGRVTNDFYIEDLGTKILYKSKSTIESVQLSSIEIQPKYAENTKRLNGTQVYAVDNDSIRKLDISQVEVESEGLKSYHYVIHDLLTNETLPFDYVMKLFN